MERIPDHQGHYQVQRQDKPKPKVNTPSKTPHKRKGTTGGQKLSGKGLNERKVGLQEKGKRRRDPFALHKALQNGLPVNEILSLIGKTEDVNVRNDDGKTALHLALEKGASLKVVKPFIAHGAKVNLKTKGNGTVLDVALVNNTPSEVVHYLLEMGAHSNGALKIGWTPLQLALAYQAPLKIVQRLIPNDGSINQANRRGNTALHIALAWNSKPEVIMSLLSKGAHVDVRNIYDRTPVQVALANKASEQVIQLLKQKGKMRPQPLLREMPVKTTLTVKQKQNKSTRTSRTQKTLKSVKGIKVDPGQSVKSFIKTLHGLGMDQGKVQDVLHQYITLRLKNKKNKPEHLINMQFKLNKYNNLNNNIESNEK